MAKQNWCFPNKSSYTNVYQHLPRDCVAAPLYFLYNTEERQNVISHSCASNNAQSF